MLADRETRNVDRFSFYGDMLPCPPELQLSLAVLVYLKTPLVAPLEEAAVGLGYQRWRHVNSRVGGVGEHIASHEPLHHGANARSDLEDAQGLLRGRSWQSRYQVLPDLPIQRPVVYTLLGSEVTR